MTGQAARTAGLGGARALELLPALMIDATRPQRFSDSCGHLAPDGVPMAVSRGSLRLHWTGGVFVRSAVEDFAAVMSGIVADGAIAAATPLVEIGRGVWIRRVTGWLATVSIAIATRLPGAGLTKSDDFMALAVLSAAEATGRQSTPPTADVSGATTVDGRTEDHLDVR